MGTYTKLPSGSIRLRVTVGKDRDGKRIVKSFTGSTKRECEAAYKQWMAAGGKLDIARGKTLGECVDDYISTGKMQGFSPSTIKGYVAIRKKAFPKLMTMDIGKITAADVQKAVNDESARVKPKTLRNEYLLIRSVLKRERSDLDLSLILLTKQQGRKKTVLRNGLAKDVLDYCREHQPADIYAYCSFIIAAGLRPSEIYALTWGDVSKDPIITIDKTRIGYITVDKARVKAVDGQYKGKTTKTEAGRRMLQVPFEFVEDLESMIPRQADDVNILTAKPADMTNHWGKTIRKALDLPDGFRYYDLRHYYATVVATSGATEDELKARMGHTSSSFSHNIYVELLEDRQAKIDSVIGKKTAALYPSKNEKRDTNGDTKFENA